MKTEGGPFATPEGPGPEYETCAALGTLCFNRDGASLLKLNERCNRFGMDTISCGATIAFGMDCVEKGLLSKSALDGIDLCWGNAPAILELLGKIARLEGIGDLFAEGSR